MAALNDFEQVSAIEQSMPGGDYFVAKMLAVPERGQVEGFSEVNRCTMARILYEKAGVIATAEEDAAFRAKISQPSE